MTTDLPHTLFFKTDKDGKPVKPKGDNGDDDSVRLNELALKRMRERKEKEPTLEQLFDDALNENE